jgi:proline iminopeptidase
MGKFFPEAYNDMLNLLSAQEQMDLVNALHTKVMSADPAVHHPIAYAFMYYDILCSILNPNYEQAKNMLSDELALSVARAFIHYAANNFFMEDNYLLNNSDRIKHIPAIIVHGRYDLICLPENAYQLHAHLPKSQLWFISNAGHASSERPLASALREAMDSLKKSVNT